MKKEIKIRCRRLFQRLYEGDWCNALVCYHKIPKEWKEECYEDGKCQAMVAKWVHCIQIDLWWLVIKIEIFGSLKSP